MNTIIFLIILGSILALSGVLLENLSLALVGVTILIVSGIVFVGGDTNPQN